MNIVTVIPLEKGVWKSDLTYFTVKNITPGDIVYVPLRNRKVLSVVISSSDINEEKSNIKDMDFNLKKITEVKDPVVFRKEFIESVVEINTYYVSRKDYGIASLIPVIFKEEYDTIAKFSPTPSPIGDTPSHSKNIAAEKLIFQAPLDDRISYYKTMIRESFALKKSVFFVLPTEHDIDIFHDTLAKGIENFSFTLHSGIKPKKLLPKIKEIITATHPVLIFGTAPYLAIARRDIGTVIVEHENATTYKSMVRPHVDLRTFTELYASKIKAKFILSSSMLRFETIARQELDGLNPIGNLSYRLGFDANFGEKIDIKKRGNNTEITFLGAKAKSKEPFKVLTEDIVEDIKQTISKKKSVFLFALRKGLATQTVCRDCNEILMCPHCQAPAVLYLSRDGKKRIFGCNRCHSEIDPETTCARCGSWNLASIGIGTDTVTEELIEIFSKNEEVKIFKLDKESAKTTKVAEIIIKEFEESPGSILVGTEMAFFFMKQKVEFSIIASFDSLWSIPNYKMSEKVIQIVTSIISRTENKLIIQTKNERDPSLIAIKNESLLTFVREELEDRKKLGYPPYKRFIKITHTGTKEEAIDTKKALLEVFHTYDPEIFSGFVARLQNKYVTNALIKLEPKEWSLPELTLGSHMNADLLAKLSSLPADIDVFIDPEDLL